MPKPWILLAALSLSACASGPSHPAAEPTYALVDAAMPLEPTPAGPEVLRVEPEAEPVPWPQNLIGPSDSAQYERTPGDKPVWRVGQTMAQGWLGATTLTSSGRSDATVPGPPAGDLDLGNLPVIGGGFQWKAAGKGIDLGLEAGLNFAFQANGGFIATGSNGATIAVSFDTLLFDLYGGGFVSKYLGDKLRIYGAAGPLLQWANYDQSSVSSLYDGNGSGFGFGYYVRAGLEFVVSHGTMVGFSGRWFETDVSLDGGMGDWDLAGAQLLFTVTRSF